VTPIEGVDLWLNTPRRPLEASGTSGQKASLNGVPNISVLNGWWPEAYDGTNGWTIGDEHEYATLAEQDAADAEALYMLLEQEVVPMFYAQRDAADVPGEWVARCKAAIMSVAPVFCTRRMLSEYVYRFYLPNALEHRA
jgi:starch phosphorylase